MGKTNRVLDKGINFKRIARDLMLRDTDGDMRRFTEKTVTPRNHKPEKYRQNYQDLED